MMVADIRPSTILIIFTSIVVGRYHSSILTVNYQFS